MEAAMKEVCLALTKTADDMAHFYNALCREAPLYTIGDKVWLNVQNIMTTCPMKKLIRRSWISLYSVDKVIS